MGRGGGGGGIETVGVLLIRLIEAPVSIPAPLRAAIRSLMDMGGGGASSDDGDAGLKRGKKVSWEGSEEQKGGEGGELERTLSSTKVRSLHLESCLSR